MMEVKNVADPEPCGCVGLGMAIHFCPLHKAAPALLAALKNATGLLSAYAGHVQDGVTDLALVEAKAAITAAEGKP